MPAIKGEKISCLGITEPDAGSDVAGIKTRAVRDGDGWVINGSKTYITNGHRADFIVLVTKTDPDAGYDGFSLFLVDMDLPGVIREKKLEKLGMHASDTALLAFQDVRVPDDALLGQEGKGFYHIMWELQGERLIGAAGCVAGAQRCFDRTLALRQRPHRLRAPDRQVPGDPAQVRGHGHEDRGRRARWSTPPPGASRTASTPCARSRWPSSTRRAWPCEVTDECLQIHGGAGYMKEYGIERAWRDMRLNRIGAGTDEVMLDVIGRSYGL